MNGWGEFTAALTLFLLSHVFPVRPPLRPWLVRVLGLRGYIVGYSTVSIALLIWLIVAASRAPYVEVIPPLEVFRWAPMVAMPVAILLAVQGLSIANPLSFGGMGKRPFDPDHPGILALTRHPLLLAIALWAGAHLLANGDLAHVVLFGLFGAFAVLSMGLIDRRKKRLLGAEWQELAKNTALLSWRGAMPGLWVGVASVALFLGLLALHAPVIGVSPLP
ncbi:MAG: NnrU family protein [Rhodobacteraceae bacterium]|nr:MAG: NnrU family protein [Paracoccaceae bacterium]